MVVWAVVLTVAQLLVAVQGALNQVGLIRLVGNRDGWPEITGWGGRAARAHRNMLENLVLFAALVLVAVATGKTNEMTLLGAQIFFWARVAHAIVYVAGIAWAHRLLAGVYGRPHRHLHPAREVAQHASARALTTRASPLRSRRIRGTLSGIHARIRSPARRAAR